MRVLTKKYRSMLVLLTAAFLTSCVHLNSVSITPIPTGKGKKVSGEASKFMFLGISFSNSYVDEAVADLKEKCPGGQIEGILTKDEVVNYFLYIFISRRIVATGQCLKG